MCWCAEIIEKLIHFLKSAYFCIWQALGESKQKILLQRKEFWKQRTSIFGNRFNFPFNLKMVCGFAKDQRNWGLNFQHVWFDSRQTRWVVVHPTMDARAKMALEDLSTSQHCSTPVNTNQHWSTLGNRFLYKTCLIDICEHQAASIP